MRSVHSIEADRKTTYNEDDDYPLQEGGVLSVQLAMKKVLRPVSPFVRAYSCISVNKKR